jgi:hypothetical protein
MVVSAASSRMRLMAGMCIQRLHMSDKKFSISHLPLAREPYEHHLHLLFARIAARVLQESTESTPTL